MIEWLLSAKKCGHSVYSPAVARFPAWLPGFTYGDYLPSIRTISTPCCAGECLSSVALCGRGASGTRPGSNRHAGRASLMGHHNGEVIEWRADAVVPALTSTAATQRCRSSARSIGVQSSRRQPDPAALCVAALSKASADGRRRSQRGAARSLPERGGCE